jgi:hypothetical protein
MKGNPTSVPLRAIAAAVAVAVLAVYAAASSYDVSAKLNAQQPDRWGAGRALDRFAAAALRLPPNADVGYLSDVTGEAAGLAFLTTQYALAPHLLVAPDATQVVWAVGNFSRPVDFAAFGARAGFRLVEDLGGGVILYQRARP